jgi:hypothetical protein
VHILFHTPLTSEQREGPVISCQDIIAMADADKNYLTKLLREMRLGVLPMIPKQSDREWVGETSPRPKKIKFQKSRIKTMLIIFLTLKASCTKNSYQREK